MVIFWRVKHLSIPIKANTIGISEIFINNDWYNLKYSGKIQSRAVGTKQHIAVTLITAGLYTLDSLEERIGLSGVIIREKNGYIWMIIPPDIEIKVSNNIQYLLGMRVNGWYEAGSTNLSKVCAPITLNQVINIHLDEAESIVDGEPSTMIGKVMLSKNRSTQKLYATPQMHKVRSGELSVINLNIKDDDGNLVNNRGQPIYITLFFQLNVKCLDNISWRIYIQLFHLHLL